MIDKLKDLFGSKRFYAGMVTSILVYVNSQAKIIDDQQMMNISMIISAWIVGETIRPTTPAAK